MKNITYRRAGGEATVREDADYAELGKVAKKQDERMVFCPLCAQFKPERQFKGVNCEACRRDRKENPKTAKRRMARRKGGLGKNF